MKKRHPLWVFVLLAFFFFSMAKAILPYLASWPLSAQYAMLFAATKLLGDALLLLFGLTKPVFYDQYAKELFVFLLVSQLTAFIAWLCLRFIGGEISPSVLSYFSFVVWEWPEDPAAKRRG